MFFTMGIDTNNIEALALKDYQQYQDTWCNEQAESV